MKESKKSYREQLLSTEWSDKRDKILKRDGFKCTKCGCNKNLQAHHKYYVNGKKAWEYPNKALTTLCKPCHHLEHNITDENHTKKVKVKVKRCSKKSPPKSRKQRELDKIKKLYDSLSPKDKELQIKYNNLKPK